MARNTKLLTPAVWGFYLIVVLEFLFMISPAALYFYASYGPVLNVLHGSAWTARTPASPEARTVTQRSIGRPFALQADIGAVTIQQPPVEVLQSGRPHQSQFLGAEVL